MARHYVSTETRRRQIAEAALHVLAEEGVARFTTRSIAARVGVTDGTLFRHFGDKQEIVLAAMDLLEEGLLEDLKIEGPPVDRLEEMFRRRAVFVGTNSSVGRLIFSEQLLHLAGAPGRLKVVGWRMRSLSFLMSAIDEARELGQIAAGIPSASLAQVIQGMLLTFALQVNLGIPESTEQMQARIDLAWTTLHTLIFR